MRHFGALECSVFSQCYIRNKWTKKRDSDCICAKTVSDILIFNITLLTVPLNLVKRLQVPHFYQ